jgi:hypothetical protein
MKKVVKFVKSYQERCLFIVVVILVALISFRAGGLREKESQSSDIKISINEGTNLTEEEKKLLALGTAVQRKGLADETQVLGENKTVKSIENCNFIGSKNSDKYHTPDCHWSEKIKEENRVCFETIEEARGKGYQAAGCCNR